MILNATEAVYQWLLFLRGKNGGIVRNRGFSQSIVGKRDFGLDSEGKSSLLFEDITFTFPSP
tara:strand:+ start:655 stop:840 length:186 start_codon:yes stop_codon:yes gene_type:complete